MENWTNEDLVDQIITKANQIQIISESNDLKDMRAELLKRLLGNVYTSSFEMVLVCPKCGCLSGEHGWITDKFGETYKCHGSDYLVPQYLERKG